MKILVPMVFAAAAFVAPALQAQEAGHVAAATDAATQWLALTDAGKPGDSWDQGAPAMRAALTREKWSEVMTAVRTPLGAVTSRKLKSAEHKKSIPGAPEGEYVIIQYDTEFANKAGASETVVPMRAADGSWQVSGYFIK
ncbi:MAG TPA: DUF4019 domain-containing protein [Telluria sp.]